MFITLLEVKLPPKLKKGFTIRMLKPFFGPLINLFRNKNELVDHKFTELHEKKLN